MSGFIKFSSAVGGTPTSNIDQISDIVGSLRRDIDPGPIEIASDNADKRYDVSSSGKFKTGKDRIKLTYPQDLFDHVGSFVFFNIRSSNVKSTIPSFDEIRLFIPQTLRVSYGAQWDEIQLPLEKLGALGSDLIEKVSSAWKSSKDISSGVIDAIMAAADSEAAMWLADNTLKSISPSLSGELRRRGFIKSPGDNQATTNPFAALNYNAPQYRQLQLEFEFLARNESEAEEIRRILKAFKLAMHPAKLERGDDAVFWDAPYIFEIYFFTPSAVNMFNFKKSALVNMNVDYGASGIQSFFKDGQPVHIKASLEFKELGYLTREDIEYNY